MSKELENTIPGKRKKVRGANFIACLVEFVLIAIYLGAGFYGIYQSSMNFDLVSMFENIFALAWFLTVAILAFSIFLLAYSPMRTKYTTVLAIFNILWAGFTIYELIVCGI